MYMRKTANTVPLKYIPFLYAGNELANITASDILRQVFQLNTNSIVCMFYVPDKKLFLGIILETCYMTLNRQNLPLIFRYLLQRISNFQSDLYVLKY